MKEFTAIYNTESLKGIKYSYRSADERAAVDYAKEKFLVFPEIVIVENDKSNDCLSGRIIFANGVEF